MGWEFYTHKENNDRIAFRYISSPVYDLAFHSICNNNPYNCYGSIWLSCEVVEEYDAVSFLHRLDAGFDYDGNIRNINKFKHQ